MKNITNKSDTLSEFKQISKPANTESDEIFNRPDSAGINSRLLDKLFLLNKNNNGVEALDLFQNNEYFTSHGGEFKHNSPLIKEWSNGVYSFNKNNDKTLPIADTIVDKLIKSYFTMIPLYKGKKTKRSERRIRRLSLDRILVSKPEIKHTNSKVIITVYLYNKNKKIIINKLKKLYNIITLKLYKPLVTAAKGQVTARGGATNKTSRLSRGNNNNFKNKNLKFKTRLPSPSRALSLKNTNHKANTVSTNNSINIRAHNSEGLIFNQPGWLNINNITEKSKQLNKTKTYTKKDLSRLDPAAETLVSAHGADTKRIIILRKKRILPKQVKAKLVLAVTNKASKTHTKLSKSLHKNSNLLNISYNVKFADRLKTRLSRFLAFFLAKKTLNTDKSNKNTNLSLRNKYALLANKYYSLTNKYRLYSEENLLTTDNNYYVYYNNILVNNNNGLTQYESNKGKKSLFTPSSGFFAKKNVKPLKNLKHINNIMQKLRGYYKLFYINNTYNNSEIFFNKGWVETAKQKYLYKLLKNPITVSNYLNKKTLSLGLKQRSKSNKQDNVLIARNKIKIIAQKGSEIVQRVRRHKNFLFRILKWNDNNFINYENKFYNKYINNVYSKELLYLYYIKMIGLNSVRFKNWFLIGLKKVLCKLYNKKVEFNFVNLKTIYLNSDIFSHAIAVKLKDRQNGLLTVLKKALTLVNLPSINNLLFYNNNYVDNNAIQNKHGSIKNILNTVKYKSVFGVRFEVAGRLSRRLTASRSVFKLRYKGSLKNIDSVYKNKPIAILRGNLKSNIQYTNVNTKTRNGAFGLKGWVSSH